MRFDTRYYDSESIIRESKIIWVPINTQIQQTIPFKISTTEVILQDALINLDDLTELNNDSVFKMEQKPVMPYEKETYVRMDITVEMNLNQK